MGLHGLLQGQLYLLPYLVGRHAQVFWYPIVSTILVIFEPSDSYGTQNCQDDTKGSQTFEVFNCLSSKYVIIYDPSNSRGGNNTNASIKVIMYDAEL
jgi:hypothetical protein